MITFQQSATIHAPVEKVFSFIADPKRIPEWRTDVPAITEVSGQTETGTTFKEEVHFMGKKQLLMKVIDYRPNEKLVIEAQKGMKLLPTQVFTFSSQGNDTLVNLEVNMKTSGVFKLIEPMLAGKLKKVWKQYFGNLGKILSSSYSI